MKKMIQTDESEQPDPRSLIDAIGINNMSQGLTNG